MTIKQTEQKRTAGRPAKMRDGQRRNVYIDDASWELAIKLGNGNASDGIRSALEFTARLITDAATTTATPPHAKPDHPPPAATAHVAAE